MQGELSYWRYKAEIKELQELNKMLQTNMYYYEYRSRDARIEVMKLEEENEILKDEILSLKRRLSEIENSKGAQCKES